MKTFVRTIISSLICLLSVDQSFAQLDNIVCGTTSAYAQQSYYAPPTNVVRNGGKEITNQGTLRVLVVYVRFQDDTRTSTDYWPNYNTLPSYAQSFVDPYIPVNGIYVAGSMSDFIDRASGEGTGREPWVHSGWLEKCTMLRRISRGLHMEVMLLFIHTFLPS